MQTPDIYKVLLAITAGLSVVFAVCFFVVLLSSVDDHDGAPRAASLKSFNSTYPFTKPLTIADGATRFRIAAITDLDRASKSKKANHTWYSLMQYGYLDVNDISNATNASVVWDADSVRLISTLAQGGRGMELSELKIFNGRLISLDDRTGVIYRISDDRKVIPWAVMPDGAGNMNKGFKAEWATVKNKELYVGGLGNEWRSKTNVVVNRDPMWIKIVTHTGVVRHVDWRHNYEKLRKAAGIKFPGYVTHESCQWSDIHGRWFFLPRRASNEAYSPEADEHRATNYMLIADEHFDHIEARRIGPLSKIRGFSAFQFVPGTDDSVVVALKSVEVDGTQNSFITVLNVNTGQVLLEEQQLPGNYKFEGVEFL